MTSRYFQAKFISKKNVKSGTISTKDRELFFFVNEDSRPYLVWDEFSVLLTRNKRSLILHHTINPNERIELFDTQETRNFLFHELGIKVLRRKPSYSGFKELPKVLGAFSIAIILSLAFLGLARWQAKHLVQFVPLKYEKDLGQAHERQLRKTALVDGSPAVVQIRELAGRVLINSHSAKKAKVYILPDPMNNAYSYPGGIIVLYTGLLKRAESPEEILGVIAHEAGHLELRHGIKSGLQEMTVAFFKAILFSDSSLLAFGDRLSQLSYSRADEESADNYALTLLKKAGISASGLAAYFERGRKNNSSEFNWLSTHPLNKIRHENIKRSRPKISPPRIHNFDLKSFKQSLP